MLAIRLHVLGDQHLATAIPYKNIGLVHYSLQNDAMARQYFQKALDIDVKVLGTDYPDTANLYGYIGQSLAREGNRSAAIFFGKLCVNSLQKIRSDISTMDEELQTAFVTSKKDHYRRLANLLIEQGCLPEAQQLLAMLKEEEFFDFIQRTSNASDIRSTSANYSSFEQAFANKHEEICKHFTSMGKKLADIKQMGTRGLDETKELRISQLEEKLEKTQLHFDGFVQDLIAKLRKTNDAGRAYQLGNKTWTP